MKIFITGASGFIGKNIHQRLKDKHDVQSPGSEELDLLDQDAVKKFVKQHRFDLVIHTATWDATTSSSKNSNTVLENNLKMFFHLENCNTHFQRMFSFGSGAEYGSEYFTPLMREESFGIHVPADQYGLSKYIINRAISNATNIYNLRLFGVFGPHEDWKIRFISNAICKALHGLDISIRQDVCFDYLYIDDLLDILELFIDREVLNCREYNICRGESTRLSSLARIIQEELNSPQKIVIAKKGLGKEYSGNNHRLLSEFQFDFRSHEESIKELIRYYKSTLSQIDRPHLSETR
jgi:UDP-glucose 4-epimerase